MTKEELEKQTGRRVGLEDKAKEFVNKAYGIFSNRAGLEERWEKNDKLYNNITTEQFYKGAANLFPPETRRACKTLINFADEVLFNVDPSFKVVGVGGPNDDKKAEVHTKILWWQQKKIHLRRKLRKLLESLIKYGFVWVKAPYVIKEKYILANLNERKKLKNKIKGEDTEKIEKELKRLYDNIDFQVKDPRSLYWNYFKPWDEQEIIIEKNMVSWEHLKILEKAEIYHGIDRLEETTTKKTPEEKSIADTWSHIKDLTGLSGSYGTDKKKFELLEAWCEFDLDGDNMDEESVITLANREHVIRLDPNPFDIQEKPYLWVCWDAIEGTSLGMGVPQLAEKDQISLNDFTNQIMDNITEILNCMKIVDDLAEIPDIQLKSRPDGIIKSKTGVEAVKFLRPPDTTASGLQAVIMSKENIRQGSGATASLQGMPTRYDTTATEYKGQGASSARDVFAKIREIEDGIITPWMRKAYSYNLQFMTREEFIKIVGKEASETFLGAKGGEPAKDLKEAIRGDHDFVCLGVTQLENKVIKGQQLINVLNLAMKTPPGIVDIPKLWSKVWKYVGDGDEIVLPQPKGDLISPEDENILMTQGEKVHAKMMENHPIHIMVHQQLDVPEGLEIVKFQHILEHQNIMLILQQNKVGGGLPAQEQPRTGPERITETKIAKVPEVPAEKP